MHTVNAYKLHTHTTHNNNSSKSSGDRSNNYNVNCKMHGCVYESYTVRCPKGITHTRIDPKARPYLIYSLLDFENELFYKHFSASKNGKILNKELQYNTLYVNS